MSEFKLQVGKTYKSREGKEVRIISCDGGYYKPYKGTNGEWYTEGGRWQSFSSEENPEDLIEEVTIPYVNQTHNEMKTLKLEVGKTYRSRSGKEVKIVEKDSGMGAYPCKGSDGERYAENGGFAYTTETPYDLIEEVTIPYVNQKHNEMKTLKLEVGKTYRSREGEEVKIVRMGNRGWAYWEGSNGRWYYEGGKGSFAAEEHPKDLIEEVPEASHTFGLVPGALTAIRYTFDIPNGMKKGTVSQEGNRIIVEMVPEERKEPKPGDVMINKDRSVYIFKGVVDDHNHEHYAWLGTSGRLAINTNTMCNPGRPATPEEAQRLWDALKKAGKRWNPETMQVEDVPESTRILEWVEKHLDDGYYTQDNIAEVIETYLNCREGKK